MSSMTGETRVVVGGVGTHSQTHHVAVIDDLGREVDDREFPATAVGYAALAGWLRSFGELAWVGVEGTTEPRSRFSAPPLSGSLVGFSAIP